jgi:hypothetical protein
MDNNECKRREMAIKEYESMRGAARHRAIAEEKRRIAEYEKQRRLLFPCTETHQVIPMTSEKYRVRAIPPWFYVDRSYAAYATPLPDLKRVMELGVWHLAPAVSEEG